MSDVFGRRVGYGLMGGLLLGGVAVAQDAVGSAAGATPTSGALTDFWPTLAGPNLAWFATVVILALTLRLRPLLSIRNLDAFVLAGMGLLLLLRASTGGPFDAGRPPGWWAYLALTVAAAYWMLRGVALLGRGGTLRYEGNVSRGAMVVLLLAGLAIGVHHVATTPLSDGSRDGVVGGLCFIDTGKLPYGQAPGYDGRSPLVCLLHAGALRLAEPTMAPEGTDTTLTLRWSERATWLEQPWEEDGDMTAARLVNALLFAGMLVGLFALGRVLDSPAVGPTMIAIFCVFPGALECVAQPDIMLPALLVTWAIVFALVPGIGGLLAMLCLVLAGAAWPWAWLGLPVMLVYFWRRGWQALSATVGLLGGVALCAAGLLALVVPNLPRADGALRLAGTPAPYTARVDADRALVLDPAAASEARGGATAWLWKLLLAGEDARLAPSGATYAVVWPNGVTGDAVRYRDVDASAAARDLLQPGYAQAVAALDWYPRLMVALRTTLEATWLDPQPATTVVTPAWELWAGPGPLEGRWLLTRRLVKVGVALLVLMATLTILFTRRAAPRHAVGGLLVVAGGSLIASSSGAATNLVWLLPPVLALWALHEAPESKVDAPGGGVFADQAEYGMSGEDGPAPRITVDN